MRAAVTCITTDRQTGRAPGRGAGGSKPFRQQASPALNETCDLRHTLSRADICKDEGPFTAHCARVAVYDFKTGADERREIDLDPLRYTSQCAGGPDGASSVGVTARLQDPPMNRQDFCARLR